MRRQKRQRAARCPRLAGVGVSEPGEFRLAKRKITVGSASGNDLIIPSPTVSRQHALLRRRFGRYRLIDLESTNGTFINGRRVNRPTLVDRGDEVRFGAARFAFLQSPATHELSNRVSATTKLLLVLVTFALGFAVTQHFINRSLTERLAEKSHGQANVAPRHERDAAQAPPSAPPIITSDVRPVAPDRTAVASVVGRDWLRYLNHWRMMAGVSQVHEDAEAVRGATAHARYMVKNYLAGNPDTPHHEEPNNTWYTPDGAKAAPNGDEYGPGPGPLKSPTYDIDGWMDGSFHRLGLIERNLRAVGYGHYCESGVCGEVLVQNSRSQADADPAWLGEFPSPVMFPSSAATLPAELTSLIYGEWPEPLSCPGYTRPAGYPITLQFDSRFVPKLVSFTLSRNGASAQVCGYDSTSYANPDQATQAWGRDVLKGQGAIVLIPKKTLEPGAAYTVNVTVQGQGDPWGWGTESPFAGQTHSYEWSFSVAP